MANTTQSQISNVFNLMVQLDPRLNFYHFGWRSDILRNIDNNFDPGVSKGREFPALHWSVPEFAQYVEAIQYTGLKEDIEMTLYFDDLQDYNNDTSANINNLIEQWDALKVIAEDFIANFEKVFCEKYRAGSITLPKFEQFSHGHNDRLITWRVTFTLTHFINCTDVANQIDLNLLPATIEESDLENYKDTGPLPDRCSALLTSLTQDDLLNCILPTYDFSDTDTQDATTAQQQTDMISWLCGPPPEVNEFSISLDGVDEFLLTKMALAAYDIERTDTFTFSFWIKPSVLQEGHIINKFLFPSGYFIRLTASGGIRVALLSAGSGLDVTTVTGVIVANQWQFVCVTYDGSSLSSGVNVYVDNVLQTLQPPTSDNLSGSISNAETLTFGAYVSAGRYYAGLLDEVRMWDIAFNASQVTTEWNGGSATPEVNEQLNNFVAFGCGEGSVFGVLNRHFPDRLQTDPLNDGFYYSQNAELADMTTDIS